MLGAINIHQPVRPLKQSLPQIPKANMHAACQHAQKGSCLTIVLRKGHLQPRVGSPHPPPGSPLRMGTPCETPLHLLWASRPAPSAGARRSRPAAAQCPLRGPHLQPPPLLAVSVPPGGPSGDPLPPAGQTAALNRDFSSPLSHAHGCDGARVILVVLQLMRS